MRYENNTMNIRQFNSNPHPFNLPGFINVFNWSLPFLVDQVLEILSVINNLVDDVQASQDEAEADKITKKRALLRSKVLSVGRVLTLYRAVHENLSRGNNAPSTSTQINKENTDNIINESRPPGLLQIIEAAKIPRTPAQLLRKESRDKILESKKLRQSNGSRIIVTAKEKPVYLVSNSS